MMVRIRTILAIPQSGLQEIVWESSLRSLLRQVLSPGNLDFSHTPHHQLLASPQACTYFEHCCRLCGLPQLRLRLWVRTRWASLYACLDRAIVLRKVNLVFSPSNLAS